MYLPVNKQMLISSSLVFLTGLIIRNFNHAIPNMPLIASLIVFIYLILCQPHSAPPNQECTIVWCKLVLKFCFNILNSIFRNHVQDELPNELRKLVINMKKLFKILWPSAFVYLVYLFTRLGCAAVYKAGNLQARRYNRWICYLWLRFWYVA